MIVTRLAFDALLQQARQRAEIMVANGLYSRFGLSAAQRVEKALLGCAGELAFEHYLKQQGIDYEVDTGSFADRRSDAFDFLIHGCKIDIKVAKKSTARPPHDGWTYGYPQEQHPGTKAYVVVGWVDLERKEVGFYGWITGEAVSRFEVRTHNSFAGYRYLTPNHEFPWGVLHKDFEALFSQLRNPPASS